MSLLLQRKLKDVHERVLNDDSNDRIRLIREKNTRFTLFGT